jgi:hypothetical protein
MKHINLFKGRSIRRKSAVDPDARDVVLVPPQPPGEISSQSAGRAPVGAAGPRRFSKKRLFLAFLIAAVSDVIGVTVAWMPPLVWALDLLTAVLLFVVLGWSWFLLPGLLLEAVPGLAVLPFWVLVVGAIAIFGSPRPRLK